MRTHTKVIGALAAAGLIAVGGTAYTEANNIDATAAGSGEKLVSALNTSGVTYTHKVADPTKLVSVGFTVDTDVNYVALQLNPTTQAQWFTSVDGAPASCTTSDQRTWVCAVSDYPVDNVTKLTIVGSNSSAV